MRLGQIFSWFASAIRGPTSEAICEIEDQELIAAIREILDNPLAHTVISDFPDLRNASEHSDGYVDAEEVLRELEERQKRLDEERKKE